jgi:hypothetical protein
MVMALADALQALLRLPGATYSCVVERDSGRVLAEVGKGEAGAGDAEGVVPYSVPRWGTAIAAMFDSTSGDELDDAMITGRRSYHLVRPLATDASVLVYLRLDRSRSNLAAARRELATVRLSGSATAAAPAAPASPSAAPSRSRADAPPAATRGAATTTSEATGGAAATRPRAAAAVVPRVRRSSGPGASADRPAGTSPRSTAETVRQIPLPRRAPGRSGPDAGPARLRPEARPGSPADPSAAPDGFAMPTVLGQSWARDPGTLRRLLAGLRKLA